MCVPAVPFHLGDEPNKEVAILEAVSVVGFTLLRQFHAPIEYFSWVHVTVL